MTIIDSGNLTMKYSKIRPQTEVDFNTHDPFSRTRSGTEHPKRNDSMHFSPT